MNELYELATVVLGCVVVGQYLHIRKHYCCQLIHLVHLYTSHHKLSLG